DDRFPRVVALRERLVDDENRRGTRAIGLDKRTPGAQRDPEHLDRTGGDDRDVGAWQAVRRLLTAWDLEPRGREHRGRELRGRRRADNSRRRFQARDEIGKEARDRRVPVLLRR